MKTLLMLSWALISSTSFAGPICIESVESVPSGPQRFEVRIETNLEKVPGLSEAIEAADQMADSLFEEDLLAAWDANDLDRVLALAQLEIRLFPIVHYVDVGICHRVLGNGFGEVRRLERDQNGNFVLYKGIRAAHLESIKNQGLNSRYGGKSGASEVTGLNLARLYDRGKMFVALTYKHAASYARFWETGDQAVLRIRVSPEDFFEKNFTANGDWFFVGVISAEYLEYQILSGPKRTESFLPLRDLK